jgi:hypothetical protein
VWQVDSYLLTSLNLISRKREVSIDDALPWKHGPTLCVFTGCLLELSEKSDNNKTYSLWVIKKDTFTLSPY